MPTDLPPGALEELSGALARLQSSRGETFRPATATVLYWMEMRGGTLLALAREAMTLRAEIAKLQDPAAVHAGMLSGRIARPTIRQLVHLTGSVPNGEDAQLAEIARLRERVKELETERDGLQEALQDSEEDGCQSEDLMLRERDRADAAQADAARLRAALEEMERLLAAAPGAMLTPAEAERAVGLIHRNFGPLLALAREALTLREEVDATWAMLECKPGDQMAACAESTVSRQRALEAEAARLRAAARAVIDMRFSTYRARNGREISIEGDDGEKVWLVPSDAITHLEAALRPAAPAPSDQGSLDDCRGTESEGHVLLSKIEQAKAVVASWSPEKRREINRHVNSILEPPAEPEPFDITKGEPGHSGP